jgi:hypothetical protein
LVILPPSPTQDTLLKQYEIQVDLLKFYLELDGKVEAFYYAMTGAIVSYALLHTDQPYVQWALVLPVIFGLLIGVVQWFGIRALRWSRIEMERLANALSLLVVPEVRMLKYTLWCGIIVRAAVVLGLFWFAIWGFPKPPLVHSFPLP